MAGAQARVARRAGRPDRSARDEAVAVAGDRDANFARAVVDTGVSRFGSLDVDFNNAGSLGELSAVDENARVAMTAQEISQCGALALRVVDDLARFAPGGERPSPLWGPRYLAAESLRSRARTEPKECGVDLSKGPMRASYAARPWSVSTMRSVTTSNGARKRPERSPRASWYTIGPMSSLSRVRTASWSGGVAESPSLAAASDISRASSRTPHPK